MADVAHPILPSAQNVKLAMDSILKAASEAIDVSPFLDARGRLPFTSLLPMMQALPNAKGTSIRSIYAAMSNGLANSIISSEITEIADYAELKIRNYLKEVSISIPNCKRLGKYAFVNCTFRPDTQSFASIEKVGELAFYYCNFSTYTTFPKLVTVGKKAFHSATGDIALPAATSIASDAFTAEWYIDADVRHTIQGVDTVRLPHLPKDFVTDMPGYPFGIKQFRYRDGSFWKTTERRIICANREILIPGEDDPEELPWP